MRRTPAVVMAGLALLLAGACGDEGGGDPTPTSGPPAATAPATPPATAAAGGSTEEVCAEVERVFGEREAESAVALESLQAAFESGDEEELARAQEEYVGQAEAAATELRAIAATAEDPELAVAVENMADVVVPFASEQAETGEQADATPMLEAYTELQAHCG